MYEGMSKGEQAKARRMVKVALGFGYKISVADGEGGWDLKQSTSEAKILDAIGNMDMDELRIRTQDGHHVGWMTLVWGNAPDGSELAADYTAGEVNLEMIANA